LLTFIELSKLDARMSLVFLDHAGFHESSELGHR
jgi:hypothetical protein